MFLGVAEYRTICGVAGPLVILDKVKVGYLLVLRHIINCCLFDFLLFEVILFLRYVIDCLRDPNTKRL